MSLGCGTLASPSGFRKGNALASSFSGKQHSLPANPEHRRINVEDVDAHWTAKQVKSPTRLWGTAELTKYHGVSRADSSPELWLRGEFWNVDSNIRVWGEHEVRRNAAAANHDVHRHDQINRTYLQTSQLGDGRSPLQTIDLEAGGFDLGARDRQGRLAPQDDRPRWKPVSYSDQFRAERSFDRNLDRIASFQRTLRKSALAGAGQAVTLMPEDIGGEAGAFVTEAEVTVENAGRSHGSRSCRGWDRYDHAPKREGAKMALGVHAPSTRAHPELYPFKGNELQPAAIYTKKFKKGGEEALRKYEPRNIRLPMA